MTTDWAGHLAATPYGAQDIGNLYNSVNALNANVANLYGTSLRFKAR